MRGFGGRPRGRTGDVHEFNGAASVAALVFGIGGDVRAPTASADAGRCLVRRNSVALARLRAPYQPPPLATAALARSAASTTTRGGGGTNAPPRREPASLRTRTNRAHRRQRLPDARAARRAELSRADAWKCRGDSRGAAPGSCTPWCRRRPRCMRTAWRPLALLDFRSPISAVGPWPPSGSRRESPARACAARGDGAGVVASMVRGVASAPSTASEAWRASLGRAVAEVAVTAAILLQLGWLWREWTPTTDAVAIERVGATVLDRREAVWIHTDVPIEAKERPPGARCLPTRRRRGMIEWSPASARSRDRAAGPLRRPSAPTSRSSRPVAVRNRGIRTPLASRPRRSRRDPSQAPPRTTVGRPPLPLVGPGFETIGEPRRWRSATPSAVDAAGGMEWSVDRRPRRFGPVSGMPRGVQLWWNGEALEESTSWRDRDPGLRLATQRALRRLAGRRTSSQSLNPDALLEGVRGRADRSP